MFRELQPTQNPAILFSQLMNKLSTDPALKERLAPDFSIIHELAPELERRVLEIAQGRLWSSI